MTYAGICYDGPCDGERRVSESNRFMIAKRHEVGFDQYFTFMPIAGLTYRWSHPLRKWVFES